MEKYYENEEKQLIKLRKESALKLNREYGIPFGENGLSRTKGHHHKTYYLAETEYNLRSLLEFDSHDEARKLLEAKTRKRNNKNK